MPRGGEVRPGPQPPALLGRPPRGGPGQGRPDEVAFIRAMNSTLISFGQAASHSSWLVQLPKPSASICATMLTDALGPLGLALRQQRRGGETLAATNSMAEAFGQAATQAPQPMQAAASIAGSASSLGTGNRVGVGRAAGGRRDEAARWR